MTNEQMVAAIQRGQSELMGELIEQNAGLIGTIARRYLWQKDCAIEMDDLRQAATVGLLESVSTFDPLAGMAFQAGPVASLKSTSARCWAFIPKKSDSRTPSKFPA